MVDKPNSTLLIQFARAPVVGQVKTRMMPNLTPRQACELHCELVLWTSATLAGSGLGEIQLSVAGAAAHGPPPQLPRAVLALPACWARKL